MKQPLERSLRSVCIVAATLFADAVGAEALTQGPNYPTTIVEEGTFPPYEPWQNPQNAAASDNVWAVYSPPGDVGSTMLLKVTGFGFAIPAGSVIEGIEVTVELHTMLLDMQSTVTDSEVRLVKGGANGATNKTGTGAVTPGAPDSFLVYGGSNDLWGETWTAADVNAADFGFAFRISAIISITFVDSISIRVFYSPPTGLCFPDTPPTCRTAGKSLLILK